MTEFKPQFPSSTYPMFFKRLNVKLFVCGNNEKITYYERGIVIYPKVVSSASPNSFKRSFMLSTSNSIP